MIDSDKIVPGKTPKEMVRIWQEENRNFYRDEIAGIVEDFETWRQFRPYKDSPDSFSFDCANPVDVEREACAKIADEYGGWPENTGSPPSDFTASGKNEAATDIAAAIRKRGTTL